MQAQDVMTTRVVAVAPDTPVTEIAKLLLERQISAVPVVSDDRRLLGIVSEGDLTHGLGQEGAKRSWWLDLLASPQTKAEAYLKSHGRLASDLMTREVSRSRRTRRGPSGAAARDARFNVYRCSGTANSSTL